MDDYREKVQATSHAAVFARFLDCRPDTLHGSERARVARIHRLSKAPDCAGLMLRQAATFAAKKHQAYRKAPIDAGLISLTFRDMMRVGTPTTTGKAEYDDEHPLDGIPARWSQQAIL